MVIFYDICTRNLNNIVIDAFCPFPDLMIFQLFLKLLFTHNINILLYSHIFDLQLFACSFNMSLFHGGSSGFVVRKLRTYLLYFYSNKG